MNHKKELLRSLWVRLSSVTRTEDGRSHRQLPAANRAAAGSSDGRLGHWGVVLAV